MMALRSRPSSISSGVDGISLSEKCKTNEFAHLDRSVKDDPQSTTAASSSSGRANFAVTLLRRRSTLGSADRQQAPPPSSLSSPEARRRSSSNSLGTLLRKRSSVISSSLGAYAGPKPVSSDGKPLKSCFGNRSPSIVSTASTARGSLDSQEEQHPTNARSFNYRRRVSFTSVQLRQYCRECGDNPSVTKGVPLAIGWKYNEGEVMDIDCYETEKECNGQPKECHRLSAQEREDILIKIGGHSRNQIVTAQFEASTDQKLRYETLDKLGGYEKAKYIGPRERVLILKESAARKLDRACKGTTSSKEQRLLWEKAQQAALLKEEEVDGEATSP